MNLKICALCLLLAVSVSIHAAPTLQEELAGMSRDMESKFYGVEEIDDKTQAVEALIARATDIHKRNPDSALARAWIGWMQFTSVYLQTNPQVAMSRLTDARANLEAALAADPSCCGATAYVSLAIIYQVPLPGLPTADPQKQFDKALALDPDGVAPNTRYAGYLMRKGELEAALKHANAALKAPPLANRPNEDKAVRAQAQTFIDQINERKKK
jgi:tetratricopeptide (TPR) repeat protein